MSAQPSRRKNRVLLALSALALVAALLIVSQRAMAEALGSFVAGVWLDVMHFLMGVVRMFFGG